MKAEIIIHPLWRKKEALDSSLMRFVAQASRLHWVWVTVAGIGRNRGLPQVPRAGRMPALRNGCGCSVSCGRNGFQSHLDVGRLIFGFQSREQAAPETEAIKDVADGDQRQHEMAAGDHTGAEYL